MTTQSDIELEKWLKSRQIKDYHNEEVQKSTVIWEEQGSCVTLYDWIHRHDGRNDISCVEFEERLADFYSNLPNELSNG